MAENIFNSKMLKYNMLAPRYTSYPTAPHFKDDISQEEFASWINSVKPDSKISLYIHIPFCSKICHYCGCHTKLTRNEDAIEQYVDFLIKEFELVASKLDNSVQINHIHFGGGTPTILAPKNFDKLINAINKNFKLSSDCETALEVDPRTITIDKVKSYSNCKINRVSFGIQDFNIDVQKAIHRVQPFELIEEVTNLFRANNIDAINFDLIYGLPKQNLKIIEENIDISLKLSPTRIAFFGYAHVPWMKKNMQLINDSDLPNQLERLKMFDLAYDKFQANGFFPIGLDHFARENDKMLTSYLEKNLHRNFQGYTTDNATTLIGFGVSSISYFDQGYVQNLTSIKQYKDHISNNKFTYQKSIKISNDDKIRREVINNIMCYLEVDLNLIYKKYGLSEDYFKNEILNLFPLIDDDLISFQDNLIKVNKKARQISRILSSIFDKYFKGGLNKHSNIT